MDPRTRSPGRRRLASAVRRAAIAFASLVAAWLALVVHPEPLFAHGVRRGNVALYARSPLPAEAAPMLDEAIGRVSRSPLFDPTGRHSVFLCGAPWTWNLLTLGARGGGLTRWGNVFIRPADVARGRVLDRWGRDKPGERTLTYYVAHELTHAIVADRIGEFASSRLSPFQREGYADYVGLDHPIDLVARRQEIRRGDPAMDPRRSGLYRRYETLVAYLLERRGMTVEQLLSKPLAQADVERQLEQDPAL